MIRIERLPSLLSPSALMMAEHMPNTFYLTRLISDSIPREKQSIAAAVGSVFDYYIKELLIKEKFKHKLKMLPEIKKGIERKEEEVFRAGLVAFNTYEKIVKIDEFTDVELHITKEIEGVPVTGKLDAQVNYQNENIPFDWKVTGYTSQSHISPLPLYYRLWEGIRPRPCHKDYTESIDFEKISENWATQLCTYGWLLGKTKYKDFPAKIDTLIFTNKVIRCIAQYKGIITKQFQEKVAQRYQNIWQELKDGSYLKRLVSTKSLNLIWIASKNEDWFKQDPFGGILS